MAAAQYRTVLMESLRLVTRHDPCIRRRSAPSVAMESAVDSRSVARETGRASFLVAAPDTPQRRKLRALQRRLRAGGAEDHADIVAAGAIDGIPKRVDFLRRHPILRVQENDASTSRAGRLSRNCRRLACTGMINPAP